MPKVGLIGCESGEQKWFKRRLGAAFDLRFAREADWKTLDPGLEVLSVFVNFNVTKDVLDFFPNLKLVACRSTGFNNVDLGEARRRKIVVANTPGYGASSVAEYAFLLMLMLSRKIVKVLDQTEKSTADGQADPDRNATRGFDLNGRTLGVVGLGAIGRGVAAIGRGVGMKVLGYDPYMNPDWARNNGVELLPELDDLVKESDVITLHIPYTPASHHLMGERRLVLMKKGALLINTARGELVDTVALVRELSAGHLGGAALDVAEEEYLLDPDQLIQDAVADHHARGQLRHAVALLALERMDNVVVTNHNAFNTVEAQERINSMTAENIEGIFTGGKVYAVKD
jgi:D-lactate dehydrogenase